MAAHPTFPDHISRAFGLDGFRHLSDIELPGSPERCAMRWALEDGDRRRYVLERLLPGQATRREALASLVRHLADSGLDQAVAWLPVVMESAGSMQMGEGHTDPAPTGPARGTGKPATPNPADQLRPGTGPSPALRPYPGVERNPHLEPELALTSPLMARFVLDDAAAPPTRLAHAGGTPGDPQEPGPNAAFQQPGSQEAAPPRADLPRPESQGSAPQGANPPGAVPHRPEPYSPEPRRPEPRRPEPYRPEPYSPAPQPGRPPISAPLFVLGDSGTAWMLSPYVANDPLPRPEFLDHAQRGAALADFLGGMRQASEGLESELLTPLERLDLPSYGRDLTRTIQERRPDLEAALRPVLDALEPLFEAWADLPLALSHGDFHPLNVLWRDQAIAGVIDWEFAGLKPELYDAANLLGCCGFEHPRAFVTGLVPAFLRGLKDHGLLTPENATSLEYGLPPLVLGLRLAWLSEWLRKKDEDMLDLELTYLSMLTASLPDMARAWRV